MTPIAAGQGLGSMSTVTGVARLRRQSALVDMILADLAFDLGSGGAIVGFPVRVVLPGSGELRFVGADAVRPLFALVHWADQSAGSARTGAG
jgi:hypothetical protein